MKVTECELPGVLLLEPDVFSDARGFFMEVWHAERYRQFGIDTTFVQDNISFSHPGVLRGLHFQNPHAQGKLISVLQGEIFDVAVDIRSGSRTFGHWAGVELSAENRRQLYISEGFAHGFVVMGDLPALVHYKCTDFYAPDADAAIRWDDPDIGIDWPLDQPLLSHKDRRAPLLRELADEKLEFGRL